MIRPHRNQPLWYAYIVHRISGVLLALFLPFHFYVLSLSITGSERMDSALAWTENPIAKFAEFGLVFLLAIHLFGGLRLLALELLPWTPRQKTLAASAAGVSFFLAIMFLLRAI